MVKAKLTHSHVFYLTVLLFGIFTGICGAASASTTLIKFKHSPFPYKESPTEEKPFFDVVEQGRRGHTSQRGGVYWEDERYNDNRVLVSIPPHFKLSKPAIIVVYLHGNLATLERDVRDRQAIPEQITDSGLNAILVAPQFAFDALDSSPGHFVDENFFEKFLLEAANKTGKWKKNRRLAESLKNAKVIVVAYSGGYQAAAAILENGGANDRIAGVVLMDALYGREQTFADLVTNNPQKFLFSIFTEGARPYNENLKALLQANNKTLIEKLPDKIIPGSLTFISLAEDTNHYTLLEDARPERPLGDILRRVNLAVK